MTPENKYSTIRKAVEGKAEELAARELLEKPEKHHLDEVFNEYKALRGISPKELEAQISIASKRKELKDQMGIDANQIFNEVWDNLYNGPTGLEIKEAEQTAQRKKYSRPTVETALQDMVEFRERFFKWMEKFIKIDPRIITAFKGKEDILNQKIEFEVSQYMRVYRAMDNRRQK